MSKRYQSPRITMQHKYGKIKINIKNPINRSKRSAFITHFRAQEDQTFLVSNPVIPTVDILITSACTFRRASYSQLNLVPFSHQKSPQPPPPRNAAIFLFLQTNRTKLPSKHQTTLLPPHKFTGRPCRNSSSRNVNKLSRCEGMQLYDVQIEFHEKWSLGDYNSNNNIYIRA
jgi:hypothetical protein